MKPLARFSKWEKDLRNSYNTDLSTPENRRRAHIYNLWFDHAALRVIWSNLYEIAPGVWRGNQPTHKRFEQLRDKGITTIINLRGVNQSPPYLAEKESCDQLGLKMINVSLAARQAAPQAEILKLIDAFRTAEKPFLMHCKSGADRAGFAGAIYLLAIEGASLNKARKMLSARFIHFKWTKTGILDHILDLYEACNTRSAISFEDWVAQEYDAETIQASFNAKRGK